MAQVRLDDDVTVDVDRYRGDDESRAAFVNTVLRDIIAVWDTPVRPRRITASSGRRVRPTPRRYQ